MEITLYEPHNAQAQVHKACRDKSVKFITMISGRQVGKTELGMNQVLEWAIVNPNARIMWVAPKASQAHKVYTNMIKGVEDKPFVKSHKGSAQDIEIRFVNGSVIMFKSAASEDSLRGETINYMVIDEAAFIKETTFQEILMPMLNVGGRKCLVITTPKGKNWVHNHYLKGVNGKKGYKSFRFTYKDNPHSNPDIIDIAREAMPEPVFRQEYLAEFIDGTSIIENIQEVTILPKIKGPLPGQKYYAGIDIGMKVDYTVFSVVDSNGNLVYYDRFTDITAPQLKQRLASNINHWKPENTLIEVNNMGGAIYDDLIHLFKIKKLNPWTTNATNKHEMITHLINAFASKDIKCVDDDVLRGELETFEMSITSTGKMKFAASNGFHDDIIMSFAIARQAVTTAAKNTFRMKFL